MVSLPEADAVNERPKKRVARPAQHALELSLGEARRVEAPYSFTRMSPARTTEVYATYWRFAAERQRVFRRRAAGEPGPWTDDPILRAHRFTNAYRAADRVSQHLIRHVVYAGHRSPEEVVFRTLLFKLFNRIATWERLTEALGTLEWRTFDAGRYGAALEAMMGRGERVFSSAYIMPTRAPGFRESRKHANLLGLLDHMMHDDLVGKLGRAKRLSDVFLTLRSYPLLGDFLAFQYAIDLNYSEVVDFDEMDFVVAGPGARSGLRKCFASPGGLSEADLIQLVAERQAEEFERHGEDFQDLWGRPLQLIDCQNLFCEVDKYARVAHPGVEGIGGRTRIKQAYAPQPGGLDLWFPPKWGLNERLGGGAG